MCDNKTPFDFVIYHRDCDDGYASAWAAWTVLKDKAHYHAAQPSDKFVNGYENKHVLMVDVTYISDTLMDSIRRKAKSFCIIDHHPHALESLDSHKNKILANTHDHSAAYLVWKFFYPEKTVPSFILYIEDNDIKGNKYKYGRYFSTALPIDYKKDPKNFEVWNKLLDKKELVNVIRSGKNISRYKEDLINRNLHGTIAKFKGHRVIVHNFATVGLNSDVANMLAKKFENEAEFAIVWMYQHNKSIYGVTMRSIKDGADLHTLAKEYGGGGHKRAAFFYYKGNIHDLFQRI